jgi:two-component sensor histidine kinase
MNPPSRSAEAARLRALHRYRILDTPSEPVYDDITLLASQLCHSPISVINFIDAERQWFKSEIGLGVRETPLDVSICAHAILETEYFEVPDTLADPRFRDNPLVTGDPHLRFYAGTLLHSSDGYPLGTLCVLDYQPRRLTASERAALAALGRQVMAQLELWAENRRLLRMVAESNHRIKNSLQVIVSLVDRERAALTQRVSSTQLERLGQHIRGLSTVHDLLTHVPATGTEQLLADALLTPIVASLQPLLGPRRIHCAIEPVPLSPRQATSLVVLVNELLSNAIKHGRGTIELRVGTERGFIWLEVQDDGAGFPPEFSTGDVTSTGLQLVESLVGWDLKGTVSFANRTSRSGGRVTVRFPIIFG